MTGKLTDKHMDQLEQWIGKYPKTFTLLYAITRDGCNATTFHQKCDNQGPTVTVLYNQQGSVYGGYAPVSWNSKEGFVNNKRAFLFQLQFNGSNKTVSFPVKQDHCQYAMYNNPSYGPIFGDGYDLKTFQGSLNSCGTYYALNGHMNGFGNSYDNQDISTNQINNGNMNVTDLEVYSVTDGERHKYFKAWRKTRTWDEKDLAEESAMLPETLTAPYPVPSSVLESTYKLLNHWLSRFIIEERINEWQKAKCLVLGVPGTMFLNELTEEIVSFKPDPDLGMTESRILMIGPVGAGKSSFYNTINSVFQGRITQKAGSGSAEQSLTKIYTPYKVKVKSGSALNFRFCDIPGLEESQGLDVLECSYLLDGNIPDYYEFNPTSAITPKTHGFKSTPSANDVIHCVVFVLDASTLDVLSTKIVDKIKSFQELMKQRGIPQIILLTKIDKTIEYLVTDVSQVFSDPEIERYVEKASQLLGLPRSNVHPVKNYENEDELEENKSILALLALRKILDFTEDFLDQMLDRRNDEMKKLTY